MKFLISGGTGFIGTALCKRLLQDEHQIVILSRSPGKIKAPIDAISSLDQLDDEAYFDVVINLAGEPIANKRWSAAQKQRIWNSRIETTNDLIACFKRLHRRPRLLISGSAIGYYGIYDEDDLIDGSFGYDDSFASQLCVQWETNALQAESLGIRTCLLRTGIVLGKNGGALRKMLPLFKLKLGGKTGSGEQWMSWIHLDDIVGIIMHCIQHNTLRRAINGTSPNPVTNLEFTETLARILKRPANFSLPTLMVKLLMGQMGKELLLSGKRILPVKIQEEEYCFQYPTLEEALTNILRH